MSKMDLYLFNSLSASDRYEHLVRYVGWYSNRARG